ncbi:SoxR reducing system RseC family protein [Candidatus Latescibacterota bacterium]
MKETGKVIELDGDRAKVTVTVSGECLNCAARAHCHGAIGGTKTLSAINRAGARVGDTAVFEVSEGRAILSAALIWILPILAMIVGYIVGEYAGGGIVSILVAFGFFGGSFLVLKAIDSALSGRSSFYPVITGVLNGPSQADENEECGH